MSALPRLLFRGFRVRTGASSLTRSVEGVRLEGLKRVRREAERSSDAGGRWVGLHRYEEGNSDDLVSRGKWMHAGGAVPRRLGKLLQRRRRRLCPHSSSGDKANWLYGSTRCCQKVKIVYYPKACSLDCDCAPVNSGTQV